MSATNRSKVINRLLSDKTALRNYEDIFTKEDLHPGSIIHSGTELRHNTNGNRNPLAEDDFSLGYREGSNWFNQITKELFVCLESNIHQTVWVKVRTNLDNVYSKTTGLVPVQENSEEFFIPIVVKEDLELKKVFSVYFLDTVRVISGWAIENNTIYFPKNSETNFMRSTFAVVSYSEGTDIAEHIT